MAVGGFGRLATAYIEVEAKIDRRRLQRETTREAKRAGDSGGTAFGQAFEKAAEGEADDAARGFGGKFSSALDQGSNAVGNAGASLGSLAGKGILLGLGAVGIATGAAAILTEAFTEAIDNAALNDLLSAQLDLTGPESARAGRVAGSLYGQAYGENLGEVNRALKGLSENVADLGSLSDEELEGMGAKALDVAKIMDEDVGRVTRAVGQLIRNGLAKNADEAFDILTRGAQEGGNATEDLLDVIEEYSADLSALGLDGPQALGAISNALQAGARNGDLAADALRELSIRAIDGSKATREAYKLAGLDADEMAQKIAKGGPTAAKATSEIIRAVGSIRDPVKQEAAGVGLFGTRFEELGVDAIVAMDPVVGKLDDVGGAAERMGKKLNDNTKTDIEAFRRRMSTNVSGFIARNVIPSLEDAADGAGRLGGHMHDAAEQIKGDWATMREALGKTRASWDRDYAAARTMVRKTRDHWDRDFESVRGYLANTRAGVARTRETWDRDFERVRGFLSRTRTSVSDARASWDRDFERVRGFLGNLRDAWDRRFEQVRGIQTRAVDNTRVAMFNIQAAWNRGLANVRTAVSGWGSRLVGWFRDLPGRITGALGNIGRAIKDKFSSILKGFSIPIKLAFGGDGIGLTSGTDRNNSLLGISPLSAIGRAYTAMGRPGRVISGYRNSVTRSGNPSLHAGRALDIVHPNMPGLMAAIISQFGPRIKELIGPAAGLGYLNGRPHRYSNAVQGDHDGRTNVAHVHWAMAQGGYFGRPTVLPGNVAIAERQDEIISPVPMLEQVFERVLAKQRGPLVGNLTVNAVSSVPQHIADAVRAELAVVELLEGVA